MPSKLNNLISDFLKILAQYGRSELTIRNYELYLKRFLEFSNNPRPGKIDKYMVEKYQEWLKDLNEESRLIEIKKNFKKNTINYHLIALRSFLKYLDEKKIDSLKPEKIKLEKIPKRKIEFLSKTEIERLLEAPMKIDAADIIKFRDRAILEILFSGGMKVNELVKLKKSDAGKNKIVIQGSKGRERGLALSNQARHYLNKYLSLRTDKLLALFVGHDRAARARKIKKLVPESNLTTRSIQRIVKKYAITAGLRKKITPQVLRNSTAMGLLSRGEDERKVQEILGYESAATMRMYGTSN